jgi:hypothetical protein
MRRQWRAGPEFSITASVTHAAYTEFSITASVTHAAYTAYMRIDLSVLRLEAEYWNAIDHLVSEI